MALVYNKTLDDGCQLGLWRIEEDYDTIYDGLQLSDEDAKRLASFMNESRKLEWLSVRRLLGEMLGHDARIVYNEKRKPFIEADTHKISITHSRNYTAILLSEKKKVGIDLEFMSHKISSISHKFINDNEHIVDTNDELKKFHLYIHWCAKEALYKICDKQDINFKTNLTLMPFEPQEQGKIRAKVTNKFWNEHFDLNYYRDDNYVIAWCSKQVT